MSTATIPWRSALAATFLAALTAAVLASDPVHPSPVVRDGALFAHLACLVLGFGAVLAVDWTALLWVVRRRELTDVVATADNVHVPIWLGFVGLVSSGLVLEPDLDRPTTLLKLGLVATIGLNGVVAGALRSPLRRGSARALVLSGMSAVVSQLGWWGATVIGFLTAR